MLAAGRVIDVPSNMPGYTSLLIAQSYGTRRLLSNVNIRLRPCQWCRQCFDFLLDRSAHFLSRVLVFPVAWPWGSLTPEKYTAQTAVISGDASVWVAFLQVSSSMLVFVLAVFKTRNITRWTHVPLLRWDFQCVLISLGGETSQRTLRSLPRKLARIERPGASPVSTIGHPGLSLMKQIPSKEWHSLGRHFPRQSRLRHKPMDSALSLSLSLSHICGMESPKKKTCRTCPRRFGMGVFWVLHALYDHK